MKIFLRFLLVGFLIGSANPVFFRVKPKKEKSGFRKSTVESEEDFSVPFSKVAETVPVVAAPDLEAPSAAEVFDLSAINAPSSISPIETPTILSSNLQLEEPPLMISADWKFTTTAEHNRNYGLVKDVVSEGLKNDADLEKFTQGFDAQAKEFSSSMMKVKSVGDEHHKVIQTQYALMGSLAESYKKCVAKLDFSIEKAKVKLSPDEIDKLRCNLLFRIYDKVADMAVPSNPDKIVLSEDICQNLIEDVVLESLLAHQKQDVSKAPVAAALNPKLDAQRAKVEEKVQKILDLESEVVSLSGKLKDFQSTQSELTAVKTSLEKEKSKKNEYASQSAQSKLEKDSLAGEIATRQERFSAEVAALKAELASVEQKLKASNDEKLEFLKKVEKTSDDLASSKKESAEIQAKLSRAEISLKSNEADLKKANEEKASVALKAKQLEIDVAAANKKVVDLESSIKIKERENDDVSRELKKQLYALEQTKLDHQVLLEKMKKVQSSLENAEGKNKEMMTTLSKRHSDNLDLQVQLSHATRLKDSAEAKMSKLKKDLSETVAVKNQIKADLKRIFGELSSKNKEIEALLKKKEKLEEKFISIREKIISNDLNLSQTKANTENLALGKKIDDLTVEIKKSNQELEKVVREKDRLSSEVSSLDASLKSKDESIDLIKKQHEDSKLASKEFEKKIQDNVKKLESNTAEIKTSVVDLGKSKDLFLQTTSQLKNLEEKHDVSFNKLNDVSLKIGDIQSKGAQVIQDVARLKQEKDSMVADINSKFNTGVEFAKNISTDFKNLDSKTSDLKNELDQKHKVVHNSISSLTSSVQEEKKAVIDHLENKLQQSMTKKDVESQMSKLIKKMS